MFLQITLSKKDLRTVRKNMVSISNATSSVSEEIESVAVTFSAGSSSLVTGWNLQQVSCKGEMLRSGQVLDGM